MSDDASVRILVKVVVDTYSGLDVMHANAAYFSQIFQDTDVLTVALEVFDRRLAVNLLGHVLCTRHA
jgi:NAD(P)-dependent dehydrogenase (short-subunit alcohol dehydrogenase family)